MSRIVTITEIRAPLERVFDLARSVDLHVRSAGATGETAIAGVTSGLIKLNEEVTWRGRHFGIWQKLTSRITAYSRPHHFQDCMVKGAFRKMTHDHYFHEHNGRTIMKDVFDFTPPFGALGRMVDRHFLRRHMKHFLLTRNEIIKRTAEGNEWKLYLPN